jgi:hypothetical protein
LRAYNLLARNSLLGKYERVNNTAIMQLQHRNKHKINMRSTSDLEVFENPKQWLKSYQEGWLAHYEETGQFDWDRYVRPKNIHAPSGPSVDLAESRLMLVSSAGGYLTDGQVPFETSNPLGDYTIRTFQSNTPFESLSYAPSNYEHSFVESDPQVLLPLQHLQDMVAEGIIGELSPSVVSFCGCQPNVIRVVKELVPAILTVAQEEEVDAALLIPTGPLCVQSVGLVARALEVNRVAATLTTWCAELIELTAPPRATATQLRQGCPLGAPKDSVQQRRVLEATLALLAQDAPVEIMHLEESAPSTRQKNRTDTRNNGDQ